MAAPMLFASQMPRSTMLPIVAAVMRMPRSPPPSRTAPAPVTVHCDVGVRCRHSLAGSGTARSDDAKCDEVMASAVRAKPPLTDIAASSRDSAIVEHAP